MNKNKPCKRCKGRGKVVSGLKADRFLGWPPDNSVAMMVCPRCHGKGSV